MNLAEARRLVEGRRAVIMCIGSDFGDDAAGRLLYDRISGKLRNMIAFECGNAPESFLPKLKELRPGVVIMVNAVDRGLEPGDMVSEDLLEAQPKLFLTHKFPLSVLAHVLASELEGDVEVILVGVQVKKMHGRACPAVRRSMAKFADILNEVDRFAKKMTRT